MKTIAWMTTLIIAAAASTASAADAPDAAQGDTAVSNTTARAAGAQPAAPAQGLTRAQVRAAVLQAREKGEIPETEADMDVAQTRKHQARSH